MKTSLNILTTNGELVKGISLASAFLVEDYIKKY